MDRLLLICLSQLILVLPLQAANIRVSTPLFYEEGEEDYAVLNLSWDNAFSTEVNRDAAWIFFKASQQGEETRHVRVSEQGHQVISSFTGVGFDVEIKSAEDQRGIFVYPSKTYSGPIHLSLKIMLERGDLNGMNLNRMAVKAYAIEMVQIPQGPFWVGDKNPDAHAHGAIYKPDGKGNFQGLVRVDTEESRFEVSPKGDLYYQAPKKYEGDQGGTIPATYPKGVQAFYMMKYEISEGEYVAFLNSLNKSQLSARNLLLTPAYAAERQKIVWDSLQRQFYTANPARPCAYLSWDDAMAFADWACLRPMTEFEFTKAARGPRTEREIDGDFPWGNKPKEKVQRLPDEAGNLHMRNGWTEFTMNMGNLVYYGASFYRVMDLAGSKWERLVSIGHPSGRAFDGQHGDGKLTEEGFADTPKWPIGNEDAGGVGFRGGGFYGYDRAYHAYNPFSPVSYRPYGGWHGTMRQPAYGTRLVRTR